MKKALFLLLLLTMLTIIVLAIPVSAVPTNGTCGDSLTWSFEGGTLTVTGTGSMKSDGSLSYWFNLKDDITHVVIGEGCTSISDSAFAHCQNLVSVSLPKSVTTIDRYAFSGCWKLSDISLTNVTSIGENAFAQCYKLTALTIPAGVTKICYGAFQNCHKLATVTLHNGVTEIDGYAFRNCAALTSITIPDSVKSIGGSAFFGCKNLTQVHLGSGLTDLGGNAFQECEKLKSVHIPDKVTEIKINTFNRCTALEELVLGAGVSKFVVSAIDNCPNLKALTLNSSNPYFKTDKGVLYTKDGATLLCIPRGFTGSYTVLPGTKTVAHSACRGGALETVTIPGSVTLIDQYAFNDCANLKSINLSYGLEHIKDSAFARTAIEEIVIPESVTKMNHLIFSGCTQLKKVVFLGYPPTFGSSVFSDEETTVYYPAGISEWKELPYMGKITWVALTCDTHTVINIPAKDPTCTENGNTAGSYCAVCKLVFTTCETISKTGHAYGTWIKNESASGDWTQKRTCSTCGYEDIIKSNFSNTPNPSPDNTKPDIQKDPKPTPQDPTTSPPAESTPIPDTTDAAPPATESIEADIPATESTEAGIPATDTSNAATDPADITNDADRNNTLLWVGIGIFALGLVASGIFILKSKFARRK